MSLDFPILAMTRGPFTLEANDDQTEFSVNQYGILEAADVAVEVSTDGGATFIRKTLGVDYSISGVGVAAGFTIVFASGRDDGDLVRHYGLAPVKNLTNYSPSNSLNAGGLNGKLDRLTIHLQEQRRDLDRALLMPLGEVGPLVMPAAEDRADGLLGFDALGAVRILAAGDGVTSAEAAAVLAAAAAYSDGHHPQYATLAALNAAAVPAAVIAVHLIERSSGKGGGARWLRCASEPSIPAACKTQDALGAWWKLDPADAITLQKCGGEGATTLDAASVNADTAMAAATAYAVASGVIVALTAFFYLATAPTFPTGLTMLGTSRALSGYRFDTSHATPGSLIRGVSNVRLEDFEIQANSIGADVGSDEGINATCITIGDYFSATAQVPTTNIALRRLRLSRTAGSASGHAISNVGRTSGVIADDMDFAGASPTTGKHYSAMTSHWGAQGVFGTSIVETYHPNNIVGRRWAVKNCLRAVTTSAVYGLHISGILQSGGVQIAQHLTGDEAAAYAVAEDAGRVHSGIVIDGVHAWDIAGSGSSVELVEIAGFGTSKVDTDPGLGGSNKLNRQPYWRNIAHLNFAVDADPSSTKMIAPRNVYGELTFRSFSGQGGAGIGSVDISNCRGSIVLDHVVGEGYSRIHNSQGVDLRSCRLTANGAQYALEVIAGGPYTGAIATGGMAQGATTLPLAATLSYDIGVKDKIIYTVGGKDYIVYSTGYYPTGTGQTSIGITAAPIAASAADVVKLYKTSEVDITATEIDSGTTTSLRIEYGQVTMRGGRIWGAGTQGVYITNGSLIGEQIVFENNGLGRISNGALATYSVNNQDGGICQLKSCTFRSSPWVTYFYRQSSGAIHGLFRDCELLGNPITGQFSLASSTVPFRAVNCVDANGVPIADPGSYFETVVAAGTAALSSGSIVNVGSLVLPAGTFDVSLSAILSPASSPVLTRIDTSISGANNTIDTTPGRFSRWSISSTGQTLTGLQTQSIPPYRITLPSGGTLYFNMRADWTTGTLAGGGTISARRAA